MPGAGARWRGSLGATMLVLAAMLSVGGMALPASADTVPVPAPPVPEPGVASNPGPQPGGAVAPCHFAPLGSSEIRTVFTDRYAAWAGAYGDPLGLPTIDPTNPCHVYRVLPGGGPSSPVGPARVVRGDTDGPSITWHDAYIAPAEPVDPEVQVFGSPGQDVTALAVPGNGAVVAASSGTRGESPHVVASQDSGSTWAARDAGLLPVRVAPYRQNGGPGAIFPPAPAILAVAPSDARTQILQAPGDDALHLTTDGGQHWSRLLFSAAYYTVSDVQFDPADPRHIFVVVNTYGPTLNSHASSVIFESRDGANSWRVLPVLQGVNAESLIVTDRSGGTLYLSTWAWTGPTQTVLSVTWLRSRDDGQTWTPFTPPTPGATLAVDPRDPSTLVWAAYPTPTQLVVVATTDDFATTPRLVRRFDAPPGTAFDMIGSDWWSTARGTLTVDDQGDFFLSRRVAAGLTSADLIAFRISALAASAGSSSPYAPSSDATTLSGTPPTQYQSAQPPSTPPVSEVTTCNLPSLAVPVNVQSRSATYTAGSITFDGRYLDYAQEDLAPGVIFRIDTHCTPAAPLRLSPADFPNTTLPVLYELSYAADYRFDDGTVGAILAVGPHGDPRLPSTESPVYAIDPVTAHAVLLFGIRTAMDNANRSRDTSMGAPLFAYDFFGGGLWTLGGTSFTQPGFQPLDGGPFQTNCMTGFTDVDTGFSSKATVPGPVSTWTVGGDGFMYVQTEDDQTVFRVDDRTCQVIDGFQHRQYVESTTENDQMACDPVSFGPGSASARSGRSTSVLWIRDSRPNTVSAYPIPAGHCPFPTLLQYTGGVKVTAAEKTTLCFVLKAMTAGAQAPLAGMPVTVTLDGADLGEGITDSSGAVCRPATMPASSGASRVAARFGGNDAYLASTAAATLMAPASAPNAGHLAQAGLVPTSGGAAPPASQVPPQPNPGSEPATSVSVQTEAQVQAQSQSQAQAVTQVQPGVMVQRRHQLQVATQEQTSAVQSPYQAVEVHRARPGPATAVVAGLVLLGWSWFGWRPRTAVARRHRER